MQAVYEEIIRLRSVNARHAKGGWRMHDPQITDLKVVEHIGAEVIELGAAVVLGGITVGETSYQGAIKEEMADVLNTVYHLMVRYGFTVEEIQEVALDKLHKRFIATEVLSDERIVKQFHTAVKCPNCQTEHIVNVKVPDTQ